MLLLWKKAYPIAPWEEQIFRDTTELQSNYNISKVAIHVSLGASGLLINNRKGRPK